jgi:hypothetical protein
MRLGPQLGEYVADVRFDDSVFVWVAYQGLLHDRVTINVTDQGLRTRRPQAAVVHFDDMNRRAEHPAAITDPAPPSARENPLIKSQLLARLCPFAC